MSSENDKESLHYNADVCIVGAGPAGIVCSLYLAREGVSVVLLEKGQHPRQKPCADCITSIPLRYLKDLLPGFIDKTIDKGVARPIGGMYAFTSKFKKIKFDYLPLEKGGNEPSLYSVDRQSFDHLLLEEAKKSELIKVIDKFKATEVNQTKNNIEVYSSGGALVRAKYLVDATGSNSNLIPTFNKKKEKAHTALGIRAYFKNVSLIDNTYCELFLDKKLMPGGIYFTPLEDGRVNVNAVVRADLAEKRNLSVKRYFFDLIKSRPELVEKFKNAELIGNFQGSKLRLGTKKRHLYGERYIKIGDAAGLIDILTANGIPQAFMSAKIGAKHLVKALQENTSELHSFKDYQKEIYAATHNYLKTGRRVFPFLRFELTYSITDFILNSFALQLEKSNYLEELVYGRKKWYHNPKLVKSLIFGMKNRGH